MEKDNYERVYENLLKRLGEVDLAAARDRIGGDREGEGLRIALLGIPFLVSAGGLVREDGRDPHPFMRIVLCHYVLRSGRGDLIGQWAGYRDFKDSAFFAGNFRDRVEERIARHFGDRPGELEEASRRLGGTRASEIPGRDRTILFQGLPRIPMLLVFNDRDEEFPASSNVLFDRSAAIWLDAECLAGLGYILADLLIERE